MEISINCNNCFGDFDETVSSIAIRDKDNCLAVIEGYTLTVYKIVLPNHTQCLQFCDLDTEDPDCRIIFTKEKTTSRNLFWNRYEVSKEDASKLIHWLRSRWQCIQGDVFSSRGFVNDNAKRERHFAKAFNSDSAIALNSLFTTEI